MKMLKKLLFLIAFIGIGYIGYEIIYLTTAPSSKYFCPEWSLLHDDYSLDNPSDSDHTFKTINDVSCLNKTRIYDFVSITSIEDIQKAIRLAHEKNLHISIAGIRHSMGGQAFFKDALVLNMAQFNKIISLDEKTKIIVVQSGATWHDIQLFLNSKNLAIKAMQSSNIFSIGGSLAVNAHGMDHIVGSVASTVHFFTIMLADGSIKKVFPHDELFNLAIGGYGLFGIILEVGLEVTDNVMYTQESKKINYKNFISYFDTIMQNKTYDLFYAHLSTSPLTFFHDIITYGYKKIDNYSQPLPELNAINLVKTRRLLLNLAKMRWYGQLLKWIVEKYIDPLLAQITNKPISRNQVMHDSVPYLENITTHDTDILQEYFIPKDSFIAFIEGTRKILKNNAITVLNGSLRFVNKETIFLNYAPTDMVALVLYLNQEISPKALSTMQQVTQELIDHTLSLGGTFYLPYQLYFTKKQLHAAYPNIDTFFALKRKYDPHLLFMNNFYALYATN